MNARIWIVFGLAITLMTLAHAQQGGSNPNGQPATTSSPSEALPQPTQAAPAYPGATGQNPEALPPLQPERHEGFWGKINPLARKKYVQRQVEPMRNRVNELDELTAANSRAIKDVDSRAQQGIRMASARANEADQHAIEASNQAQMAGQTAQQATTRLQSVQQAVSNIDQYQPVTETEIRLRPGQAALSPKAKEALNQMADSVKGQNAYLFEVQAFSSGKGAEAIETSQHVAESVVRYLVLTHDIPVYRIYLLNMGNTPMSAAGESGKTTRIIGSRVQVSLLKNTHLEELAAASPVQSLKQNAGANQPAPQQPQVSAPQR
jgi:outer membrane protein OmpA-like peptidoglycan-associated protein